MNAKESGKTPLVIITGASTGIGFELAKQFAKNGHELAIVSNSDKIYEAALDLREFGQKVYEFKYDLSRREGVEKFFQEIKNLDKEVETAVLNAGVGVGGEFVKTDIRDELNLINLNIVGTVHLTKLLLKELIPNGGRLMFTSSISSDMPSPFEAVYGASKAFIQSFANALREEISESNISVTTLLPGPTNTNFFDRAGLSDTKVGAEMKYDNEPEDVARQGFEAVMNRNHEVIAAGTKTKIQGFINKYLPERLKGLIHKEMSEPGSATH